MLPFQIILLFISMTSLGITDTGDDKVIFTPVSESQIWIEGTTTINDFQCEAGSFDGKGVLEKGNSISGQQAKVKREELTIWAKIPVESFDCGKNRMNRDLYNALKGDEFPHIIFEFKEAIPTNDSNGDMFKVTGDLTIAGVTKEVMFDVKGDQKNEKYWRAVGNTDISMNDFNIDLPSPMLGMIKVRDQMTVNFVLIVEPQNAFITSEIHE
ncbi:MAG: YceI family protein [Balneolales bacterium]